MAKLLIVTEKPSQRRNFEAALGGQTGTLDNGDSFILTNGAGALTELAGPEVYDPNWANWDLDSIPWDRSKIDWKDIVPSKDSKQTLDHIKELSKQADVWVLSGDDDPESGQGTKIGVDIMKYAGWKGPVKRCYFVDESPAEIKKGVNNLVDVPDVDDFGEYLKGVARSHFDWYDGLQLTRAATLIGRQSGYHVRVANEGRLKSFMLVTVFDREQARKNYVRKPFFTVRFQDEHSHIYKRKDDEEDRFENKDDVDINKFHDSPVTNVKKEKKTQAPSRLIDLSGIASILAPLGFSSKEVLNTYQDMYQASVVSYPRTEDTTITPEQFKELVVHTDEIANLVGVDPSILTHRTPRKTHVKEGGAHGANRPGKNIPKSLDDLSHFGKSAKDIYIVVAKSFLAMLAEDYEYEHISASLLNYPEFATNYNVPIKKNWKQVFDEDNEDNDANKIDPEVGKTAEPFVFEGANTKPSAPTTKWLMSILKRYDIGTGATRTGTLSQLVDNSTPLINQSKRGLLSMSVNGNISAVLAHDTKIADAATTKALFKMMRDVEDKLISVNDVLDFGQKLLLEDMDVMKKNAPKLAQFVEKTSGKGGHESLGKLPNGNDVYEGKSGYFDKEFLSFMKERQDNPKIEMRGFYLPKIGNRGWAPVKPISGSQMRQFLKNGTVTVKITFKKSKKTIDTPLAFDKMSGSYKFAFEEHKKIERSFAGTFAGVDMVEDEKSYRSKDFRYDPNTKTSTGTLIPKHTIGRNILQNDFDLSDLEKLFAGKEITKAVKWAKSGQVSDAIFFLNSSKQLKLKFPERKIELPKAGSGWETKAYKMQTPWTSDDINALAGGGYAEKEMLWHKSGKTSTTRIYFDKKKGLRFDFGN